MSTLHPQKVSTEKVSPDDTPRARASARLLLALLFACVCGAPSPRAQVRPPDASQPRQPQQRQATEKKATQGAADDDEAESESESADVFAPQVRDPATILRKARFVLVRSDSVFVSGEEVEDSLRKRKEFQAWGMTITRSEADADLIIQITRKSLTRRFTFVVIDPRTMEVVTSGKTRKVTFGKKIANKVAEKFANRVKVYRPYPPA